MDQCMFVDKCPFFNDKMAGMPGVARALKGQFCLNDFQGCARYQARQLLGPGKVPADLYPNQPERLRLLGA